MRLTSRPANAADIAQFYPGMTTSFRAWVCEIDGSPQGIIGFALTLPCRCMFSVAREPLRQHLRSLTCLRLIKKAHDVLKASVIPTLAIAEPDEPEATKILERLGFSHLGQFGEDQVYQFTPEEVRAAPAE